MTDEVAGAAGSGVAALHVDGALSGEAGEGLAPTGAPSGSRPLTQPYGVHNQTGDACSNNTPSGLSEDGARVSSILPIHHAPVTRDAR